MNAHLQSDVDQKPWVVVENPGTDRQRVVADFDSYVEAYGWVRKSEGDVMRRMDDGTLTTEY